MTIRYRDTSEETVITAAYVLDATETGELLPLSLPGSVLHRSAPHDVARTEHLTFICTPSEDMVGPTNNWMDNKQAYAKLRPLFSSCMRGRTMYVIPFVMGPIGSPLAKVGVLLWAIQLRDPAGVTPRAEGTDGPPPEEVRRRPSPATHSGGASAKRATPTSSTGSTTGRSSSSTSTPP